MEKFGTHAVSGTKQNIFGRLLIKVLNQGKSEEILGFKLTEFFLNRPIKN